jgi:lipopolysaccharide transport system ATP-binding protein
MGRVVLHGSHGALLELGAGFHLEYTGRENLALAGALLGFESAELKRRLPRSSRSPTSAATSTSR